MYFLSKEKSTPGEVGKRVFVRYYGKHVDHGRTQRASLRATEQHSLIIYHHLIPSLTLGRRLRINRKMLP